MEVTDLLSASEKEQENLEFNRQSTIRLINAGSECMRVRRVISQIVCAIAFMVAGILALTLLPTLIKLLGAVSILISICYLLVTIGEQRWIAHDQGNKVIRILKKSGVVGCKSTYEIVNYDFGSRVCEIIIYGDPDNRKLLRIDPDLDTQDASGYVVNIMMIDRALKEAGLKRKTSTSC